MITELHNIFFDFSWFSSQQPCIASVAHSPYAVSATAHGIERIGSGPACTLPG